MSEPEAPLSPEAVGARAARGAAWVALEQWGGQLVGLAAFLLLARLLAPDAFGLLAMAGVVVALLQAIVQQGYADAVVQRRHVTPALLDTAFWSTLGLGVVAGALAAAASGLIAGVFSAPELGPVIIAMAATVPLSALGTMHHALLRRRMDFRPLATRGLIANLVGGLAGVVVALYGGGVWSLVLQTLMTAAVGSLLLWRAVRWRPGRAFELPLFRELTAFAGSLIGANLVNFANRYADDLIIGLFLGPVALGYYTIAYRLLWSATRVLTGVASVVALPAFSRLHAEPERLRESFYAGVRVVGLIALPAFAGLAVLAPELIATFFGSRWAPAAPALRVLAAIGLLHSLYCLNPGAMTAAGRPAWVLRISALNGVLNVIAFSIAVQWGIIGVAVAYVVRGYVTSPLPLAVLRHLIGIDPVRYARQLAGATGAALVMAAAVAGLRALLETSPGLELLAGITAGVVTYTLALALTDREGLARVRQVIRQIVSPADLDVVPGAMRAL